MSVQRIINATKATRTIAGTAEVTRTINAPDGLTIVRQINATTRAMAVPSNVTRTIGLMVTLGEKGNDGDPGPAGATGGSVPWIEQTVNTQNYPVQGVDVTFAAVGIVSTDPIEVTLAPTTTADENEPDMLDIGWLHAFAQTDIITINMQFREPTSGPIKILWRKS